MLHTDCTDQRSSQHELDPSFSILDVVRYQQGIHIKSLITSTYLTSCNQRTRAGISSSVVVIKQAVGNEAAF